MMLDKTLSVIQCHILFDDERGRKRLEHQKSFKGIPSFGKVFENCHFYVNYKTETFLDEVKETYEKYVKNIHLYNNLEGPDFNWVAVKLALVRESTTPYVMFSTEDRMFHGEVCEKKYVDSGKELFLFKAKDAPVKMTSFSADAIYKREFIIQKLEEMVNVYGLKPYSPNSNLSQNTSKYFEDYYTDRYGNGIRQCGNMMCAVPKREIIVSDETPGESLGTLLETSEEIINMGVRN